MDGLTDHESQLIYLSDSARIEKVYHLYRVARWACVEKARQRVDRLSAGTWPSSTVRAYAATQNWFSIDWSGAERYRTTVSSPSICLPPPPLSLSLYPHALKTSALRSVAEWSQILWHAMYHMRSKLPSA